MIEITIQKIAELEEGVREALEISLDTVGGLEAWTAETGNSIEITEVATAEKALWWEIKAGDFWSGTFTGMATPGPYGEIMVTWDDNGGEF